MSYLVKNHIAYKRHLQLMKVKYKCSCEKANRKILVNRVQDIKQQSREGKLILITDPIYNEDMNHKLLCEKQHSFEIHNVALQNFKKK